MLRRLDDVENTSLRLVWGSLNGTLALANGGYNPHANDKLTLVTTGGTVTGKFAAFSNPFVGGTGYNLVDLVYGKNSVVLEFLNQTTPVSPVPPRVPTNPGTPSAGVSVQWTPAFSTYVSYDGQLGRDRYDSNAVIGGIRISFNLLAAVSAPRDQAWQIFCTAHSVRLPWDKVAAANLRLSRKWLHVVWSQSFVAILKTI